ncbi:MAG: hypothetical protein ACOYL6_11430 [Bacteriovoracaceae bacterium]
MNTILNHKRSSFLRTERGLGLVEVLVASGIMSGLIFALMKVSKNSGHIQKRDTANQSRSMLFSQLNRNMGNTASCMNSLSAAVTSANASGTINIPSIKDKLNNVAFQVGTKYGDLTVSSITFSGYNAVSGMARLIVRATFLQDGKALDVKPVMLNVATTFDGETGSMTTCSSGGSENFWLAMTTPDLGIFYNSGSVMIGTGTTNTGSHDPAFAVGEGNYVVAMGALAAGQNNSIDANSPFSSALGGSNSITGVYSQTLGYDNTVNISTGSVGSSGPLASTAIGYGNMVTGSEAHAIGVNNNVSERYGISIGVANTVGAVSGLALGVSNVVSSANGIALGTFAEANGARAIGIGSYVKSNASGAMTVGDNSASTYVINPTLNSFLARFDGGFIFHSNTAMSEAQTLYYDNGYLGVNKSVATTNATVKPAVSNSVVALEVNGGISRLSQEAWITPSITNTPVFWTTRPGYETTQYYKDSNGSVNIRGFLTATSANVCTTSTTAFTLPAGYRPSTDLHFYQAGVEPATSVNTLLYQVTVTASGAVNFFGYCGTGVAWIQFTGINFRAEQ